MDFNEAYDNTNTSVGLAARMGNVELLKELLPKVCPTNGHAMRGWRPLHEAAKRGHVQCVRLLLSAEDVSVDALNHSGETALQVACLPDPCHQEIVKRLLCAGADPNVTDGDDWDCPLTKAVAGNLLGIVKLLLDAGADPNRIDCRNGGPLHISAEHGYFDIAKLLLERGAKSDLKYEAELTALHVLMFPPLLLKGDSKLVPFIDLLVENGCDVNAQMSDGRTPLMLAVQENLEAAVSRLLEVGADPYIMNEDGAMALHFAIEFCPDTSHSWSSSKVLKDEEGDMTILKKILDLTDKDMIIPEFSIFHLAIELDKFNSLITLIDAGLPPDAFLKETANAALDDAEVALDYADADVDLFCQVPLVIDIGTEVDTPLGFLLSKPLTKKRVLIAKYMIDKGSKINAITPKCLPPLVAAVKHQRAMYDRTCPGLEIIEYFLQNDVDVMHKIRSSDVLPAALHVSSLCNVNAFFAILVRGVPVHKIYTQKTLEALSRVYYMSSYYTVHPLFPWLVISWLAVIDMFIPQLPLHTKSTFDIDRMVIDDHLTKAWKALDSAIGTPKKLEQLCVIAVRQAVGESTGWKNVSESLELTLLNEPLPEIIMDLLQFKQVEKKSLYQWPPQSSLASYMLQSYATDNWLTSSESETSSDEEEEADRVSDMIRDEREDSGDNERMAENEENMSSDHSNDDDSDSDDNSSDDSDDDGDDSQEDNPMNKTASDEGEASDNEGSRKRLKTDDT